MPSVLVRVAQVRSGMHHACPARRLAELIRRVRGHPRAGRTAGRSRASTRASPGLKRSASLPARAAHTATRASRTRLPGRRLDFALAPQPLPLRCLDPCLASRKSFHIPRYDMPAAVRVFSSIDAHHWIGKHSTFATPAGWLHITVRCFTGANHSEFRTLIPILANSG